MAEIFYDITVCTKDIRDLKEKLEQAESHLRFLQSIKMSDSERVFVLYVPEVTKKLYFDSIESLKFWLVKYGHIDDTRYSEFTNFSEIENWMVIAKVTEYISLDIYTDIVKAQPFYSFGVPLDITFPVIRFFIYR